MAAQTDRGVPLSTLCPKFLHTNSTSHTWPFSAIAELIDNAYDPDVRAKQFWIDKTVINEHECLSFMDNGNGLDLEIMHKMLSFGYSDKIPVKGIKPIGMYGNGFKSGSMRLGKDTIVFSKSRSVSCVGMLSQTYLEQIGANQISVPIVCFEQREANKFSVREEHKASLQDILRYSPFKTQEELLKEIDAITYHSPTGTRIIIWNLRRTSTGTTEFDFAKDRYDIRIPSDIYDSMADTPQTAERATPYIPESSYSLRAYCRILYLKPRMQIIIRGQKVKSQLIAKSLAFIQKDHYKPAFLNRRIPITFGYNTKSKDQYGIMMYHKNRLIKAYERLGCQLKANHKGVGVIGVIECDFLEPTHNKQSFNETDKYRKTLTNLGTKLEEYWTEINFRKKKEDPNGTIPVEDTMKQPDQNWVQCDDCLQWRKLPDGIDCNKLPDKWFCHMNPDPQFRNCTVEQEAVDSDDEQPSYRKTYKQQEKEDKRNQEKERQKAEEDRKRQEEQRLANLARQKNTARRLQTVQSPSTPSTPTTPRSRFTTVSSRGGAARAESRLRSSTPSQAACSPSSGSGLPIISNVCSLSPGIQSPSPLRVKRTQPLTPQVTPKRPKMNSILQGNSDTSILLDVIPQSSPSLLINDVAADDDDDDDNTDDDIFILEIDSTPKPKNPCLDMTRVKKEQEQSDDAALDGASANNVAETGSAVSAAVGTSPSPAPPQVVCNITTQTVVPKMKKEVESQDEPRAEQSTSNGSGRNQSSDVGTSVDQIVIKQERSGEARSENQEKQVLQNGVTPHLYSDEDAGPSCGNACDKKDPSLHYPNMTEVQEQQDKLIDIMQTTAQERDSFKKQVQKLTRELQDAQGRLQELSQINVQKECSDQASQTEVTEDYKDLFEKAKRKVNELIKDKEVLLAATETKPSTSQEDREKDIDEIAVQVDCLIRELDRSNKEREELRSQLDSLEEERASLAIQCEELRLSLQQQRENAQERSTTPHRTTDPTVQNVPEEAAGTANPGTDSSLIGLRRNVGRLLVTYVPFMDLNQVNYECNVIDELLEQFVSDQGPFAPVGLSDRGPEQ